MPDIPVFSGSNIRGSNLSARVCIDGGSQTTLVRNQFAEDAGWSYSKADYSLASIGSSAKWIKDELWNISLKDNNDNVNIINFYGIHDIMLDNWPFASIMKLSKKIPCILRVLKK